MDSQNGSFKIAVQNLTHWIPLTHVCLSVNWVITGAAKSLFHVMHQAIAYTNDNLLLIGPLRTNTAECQYNMILYTWLLQLGQNMNGSLNPKKTPHISP